ncbi:Retrovirus-related Pol polyprotein from transposon TNT 1-94 [Eumeta japonica]|uniref:Retrovirus-related Pol polyprotein from transposon TNT 1-94 n=1 Tax=Eumeta variegata TaxID=151549 RepID=A0A4C1XVM2_EUMVA|nr:Retrovirus-related Pol polyprotein from transposon TNT 1-94 [Eumeta japonica]
MQYLEMKDLGKATQCVDLNVTRDGENIMIDQEKYIKDVLDRFGMSDCKSCKTPVEVGQKFPQSSDGKETDYPYQQAIGCLLYIAQGTRPLHRVRPDGTCECRRRVTCAMDDAWKSSRHRMSQETVTGRFLPSCPAGGGERRPGGVRELRSMT